MLLGRRVAYQPDLKASASELTFGKNVTIPGQLLSDPEESIDQSSEELLSLIRRKVDVDTRQPSRHNPPEKKYPPIPDDVTHVYTRQHQTTGLQPPFEGPFRVEERVSRSVWKIEVGSYKDGRKRYEYRHLDDLKFAHPNSLAAPAERAKLGRPTSNPLEGSTSTKSMASAGTPINRFDYLPKPPTNVNNQSGGNQTRAVVNAPSAFRDPARENSNGPPPVPPFTSRPVRASRNPRPKYVDAIWSASPIELDLINASINKGLP